MNKGIGQYDLEYKSCPCFWGTDPGKFVKIIPSNFKGKKVLDLGAGEGKNSIYLASRGYNVTAVEISKFAIKNFYEVLGKQPLNIRRKISIINQDALKFETSESYDIVIAYGLFHCLPSLSDVDALIKKIRLWVKENGIIIAVSFNDKIKVPEVQSYLEPTLLPDKYLLNAFSNWEVLNYEDDIITETHPTSNKSHEHSLSRIIAKNTQCN